MSADEDELAECIAELRLLIAECQSLKDDVLAIMIEQGDARTMQALAKYFAQPRDWRFAPPAGHA